MTTQCLFISLGQWSLAKKPSIFSHLICYFGKNSQPLGPLPFVNIFLELFTGGLPPPAFWGCYGSWYGHFGLERLFFFKILNRRNISWKSNWYCWNEKHQIRWKTWCHQCRKWRVEFFKRWIVIKQKSCKAGHYRVDMFISTRPTFSDFCSIFGNFHSWAGCVQFQTSLSRYFLPLPLLLPIILNDSLIANQGKRLGANEQLFVVSDFWTMLCVFRAHICHEYHKLYLWRKIIMWKILGNSEEILGYFGKSWEILPQLREPVKNVLADFAR